ncbi:DsbA family protein [Microbacterium keratanolyticum]|uniref:DsbA family protein n=1 Tax=Microbacterium keratanolyticum TaxID=67574 RepID=UPI003625067E
MAAAKGKTNWFAIIISAVVVVALVGLGAVVVNLNNQATAPAEMPKAEIVDQETGAISFGSGKTEVDTFLDFMCPACNAFEQKHGAALQEAAANDDITLKVHPIAILDHLSQGTNYSSRAAGAMYCVAEEAPDAALDFLNLMFANQPQEGTTGLDDAAIAAIAKEAGAEAASTCITDGTYKKVGAQQAQAHEIRGTPTVKIDGQEVENPINSDVIPKLLASFSE